MKVINRPKGTKETFIEDSTVASNNFGLPIANMVAAVTSGSNNIGIVSSSYESTTGRLKFQVGFNELGTGMITVTTTFSGSEEAIVTPYRFRVTSITRTPVFQDYQ